ncbi:MAG: hydrogenase maturation protease [Nostoc sp. EfeVER01]|uniref:hydrogenase maturation protease n=1 Tax=unclassified Nostoc TaxID=2593658 RepID=UPI002AD387B5|nr:MULTISPECIES: hydrogenase maturation protease [unclassified Nostoc]MDZ7948012.1 hydrogenase maturation protease [Nostoc sp. EfeVER01]MDZ7991369.1 hydrogenase maturation protease [Nostoc sp. EspVER01]
MSRSAGYAYAIGYGNELRSDDGIGPRVARALQLSNVKSIAVHQLTPELAQALANSDLAVFIDACLASENSQVQVQSLLPNSSNVIAGHTADPRSLLALTQAIYGYCPPAWWVTIPGENFELGENLSPLAEQGIEIAIDQINHLIKTARKELCMKLAKSRKFPAAD